MNLLFEPEMKMLQYDFRLFVSCNNAPKYWRYKQDFYILKQQLLKQMGTSCGYDRQIIKDSCQVCDGDGIYKGYRRNEECRSCAGTGIYQTRIYILARYILNGQLFHFPTEETQVKTEQDIYGLIEHPEPEVNPQFAYLCLTYKYQREQFYMMIRTLENNMKRADWKRWGELSKQYDNLFDTLAAWYHVSYDTITDDLPF